MDPLSTVLLAGALLLLGLLVGVVLVAHLRRRGDGRLLIGACKLLVAVPIRLWWRVTYVGFEAIPDRPPEGGLIVVANHTSGLDPVIVEYRCNYDIRWMMWAEMMVPGVRWFTRWKRVIPISFGAGDRAALKRSVEIVRDGGVLGVFPEGGIERPAGRIRPFMHGVGLLVAKTGAPVVLLHISGIPERADAFSSILRPCRARVEVVEVMAFTGRRDVAGISEDLRTRLQAACGWPLEDEPLNPESGG